MPRLRSKLTYANVIASIALFIALGGAAYAANSLPKNSVGSKQLKKGAVHAVDIGKGAVTPAKISAAVSATLKGATGPQGLRGPQGAPGAPGFSSAVMRFSEQTVSGKSLSGQIRANCQPGEAAIGGGIGFTTSPGTDDHVMYSGPGAGSGSSGVQGATPDRWEATIYNSEASPKVARVYAVCVK